MSSDMLEKCVLQLKEVGVLKFGDFTLKSGLQSPVYFDLRIVISYPKLMVRILTFYIKILINAFKVLKLICLCRHRLKVGQHEP